MCKSNLKATWKLIGTLIKRKTKTQTTPQKIVRNNKIYTSTEDIADQFNKHFSNVGPNLASKIDKSNDNPTQYISSPLITVLRALPLPHWKVFDNLLTSFWQLPYEMPNQNA